MPTISIPNVGNTAVEEFNSNEPQLRLIATEASIALYGFVDRGYDAPSTFVITRQTGADQRFERLEHDLASAVAEFDQLLGLSLAEIPAPSGAGKVGEPLPADTLPL